MTCWAAWSPGTSSPSIATAGASQPWRCARTRLPGFAVHCWRSQSAQRAAILTDDREVMGGWLSAYRSTCRAGYKPTYRDRRTSRPEDHARHGTVMRTNPRQSADAQGVTIIGRSLSPSPDSQRGPRARSGTSARPPVLGCPRQRVRRQAGCSALRRPADSPGPGRPVCRDRLVPADGPRPDLLRWFGTQDDITLEDFAWQLVETPDGPDFVSTL